MQIDSLYALKFLISSLDSHLLIKGPGKNPGYIKKLDLQQQRDGWPAASTLKKISDLYGLSKHSKSSNGQSACAGL